MKTAIVRLLENMCEWTGHRRVCRLATWSDRLDQRWATGVWSTTSTEIPDDEDDDE